MKSSGAWLVSEGRVLASAEIAADSNSRRRGLIGRDHHFPVPLDSYLWHEVRFRYCLPRH